MFLTQMLVTTATSRATKNYDGDEVVVVAVVF